MVRYPAGILRVHSIDYSTAYSKLEKRKHSYSQYSRHVKLCSGDLCILSGCLKEGFYFVHSLSLSGSLDSAISISYLSKRSQDTTKIVVNVV